MAVGRRWAFGQDCRGRKSWAEGRVGGEVRSEEGPLEQAWWKDVGAHGARMVSRRAAAWSGAWPVLSPNFVKPDFTSVAVPHPKLLRVPRGRQPRPSHGESAPLSHVVGRIIGTVVNLVDYGTGASTQARAGPVRGRIPPPSVDVLVHGIPPCPGQPADPSCWLPPETTFDDSPKLSPRRSLQPVCTCGIATAALVNLRENGDRRMPGFTQFDSTKSMRGTAGEGPSPAGSDEAVRVAGSRSQAARPP